MTQFEIWSLIISAFSAIGTISAVIVALWAVLRKKSRFAVKDVSVRGEMIAVGEAENMHFEMKEAYAHFFIENMQDFRLEIMLAEIVLRRKLPGKSEGSEGIHIRESLRGNFIPAQSQYEVRLNLRGGKVRFAKEEIDEITYELRTSAGDITSIFPKKWRASLLECLDYETEKRQESDKEDGWTNSPEQLQ